MFRGVFLALALTFGVGSGIYAQGQMQDVVYLKDGSIIRGMIIEMVPNAAIKVQMKDGSVFVFKMENVDRITKEPELKPGTVQEPFTEKTFKPPPDTALARARADSLIRANDESEKERNRNKKRSYVSLSYGMAFFPSNTPSSVVPSGESVNAYGAETFSTGSGWSWMMSVSNVKYKTTKKVKNGTAVSYRRWIPFEGYSSLWADSLVFQYGISVPFSFSVGYHKEVNSPHVTGYGAGVFFGVAITDVFFRLKEVFNDPSIEPSGEYYANGKRYALAVSEKILAPFVGIEATTPLLSEDPPIILFMKMKKMFVSHDFYGDGDILKVDFGLMEMYGGIAVGL